MTPRNETSSTPHLHALPPRKVLLLGGSGFIGKHLCHALNRLQIHCTVTSRKPAHRQVLTLPFVHTVALDIWDTTSLRELLCTHDTVINLIAILHGSKQEFHTLHAEFPQRLGQLCAAENVKQLIHISALGANAQGSSHYQRSKGIGEQHLLAHKANCSLHIVRPSVVFGKDDQFINLFARIQRLAPLVPLAFAHTRFQPVSVHDVVDGLLRIMQMQEKAHPVYEFAGPDIISLREIVRIAGHWSGYRRWIMPLPAPLGYLQAAVLSALPGPPLMSRDNLDSMRVDNIILHPGPNLQDLLDRPLQKLTHMFAPLSARKNLP